MFLASCGSSFDTKVSNVDTCNKYMDYTVCLYKAMNLSDEQIKKNLEDAKKDFSKLNDNQAKTTCEWYFEAAKNVPASITNCKVEDYQ